MDDQIMAEAVEQLLSAAPDASHDQIEHAVHELESLARRAATWNLWVQGEIRLGLRDDGALSFHAKVPLRSI